MLKRRLQKEEDLAVVVVVVAVVVEVVQEESGVMCPALLRQSKTRLICQVMMVRMALVPSSLFVLLLSVVYLPYFINSLMRCKYYTFCINRGVMIFTMFMKLSRDMILDLLT